MISQRSHLKAVRQRGREKDTTHPFLLPLFAQVQSHAKKKKNMHTPMHVRAHTHRHTHMLMGYWWVSDLLYTICLCFTTPLCLWMILPDRPGAVTLAAVGVFLLWKKRISINSTPVPPCLYEQILSHLLTHLPTLPLLPLEQFRSNNILRTQNLYKFDFYTVLIILAPKS